ncbi:MAG: T9SS type A sorting domain-containing protein [Chitinophagaceae bacterium]|nr:T9SS type A sorting domain-containing protein [Chitinophagaceae bacterium]
MALIRYLLTAAVWLFAYVNIQAQTVYYPAGASQLLKSTAADMAMLLQRSIAGSHFIAQPYNSVPATGIILIYDEAIAANQTCKVKGNGNNSLTFSASQDNGLNYGIYEYLHQLGFRFYQPGAAWEIIPPLGSPYISTDTVYSCKFNYKTWFISGGCSTWAMDNNSSYYWDTYYGENGHQWALYQRRNNMVGGIRFAGHRDDIMTTAYKANLQNNPCYVAPYNGSRAATGQSVADVNNIAAMQLWSTSIEKQYTQFRNTIFGNADIYKNYYRNFNYAYGSIGIEVPDGAHWANSTEYSCGNAKFIKESDQHFTLANFTAAAINAVYPDKRFQLYAYDSHADLPSSNITINANIDVQVVPTAFQNETSSKGLLNRWYGRTHNISEYHYLNLAQWSGETPSFYLDDLKTTVARLKEKQSQGIVWEAAPSKFASLPFLLAANSSLKNNIALDDELHAFCNNLFDNAAGTIYQLLQHWSNDKTVTVSNGIQDNKYKLPFYFQLVNQAATETQNASPVVKERVRELKAYLHYMQLYYDWIFDQRPVDHKKEKAAALCLYLAKINRLQVVNSYFLINDIVNRYQTTDNVYSRYNITNGTAYQNGTLPLINAEEIENDFTADLAMQNSFTGQFFYKNANEIKAQFENSNLLPLEKINVQVGYTNGKDYSARSEFYFIADKAGSVTIKYNPRFDMPGKGYINFTVEAVDQTLGILKDFSIDNNSSQGVLYVALPEAGTYKLSIVSKYKSAAAITITTNGNYFYKNGPFLGNTVENYRGDLLSLPGYFYVPPGIDKVYFSLNNSNPGGAGFATAAEVGKAFVFKDNGNNTVEPALVNTSDSALFYLKVPSGSHGAFWQSFKMEQYRLCFANTSNIQWYARRKSCTAADFTAVIKPGSETCITQLKTTAAANNLQWQVYDAQQWHNYNNVQEINLPENISPNAIVTLKTGEYCMITKRIGDDPVYIRQKTACATGATTVDASTKVLLYPNPGTGLFKCTQNGEPVIAEEINVHNVTGIRMANFTNTQQFNIAALPPGVYFYTLLINKSVYKGKLVKI